MAASSALEPKFMKVTPQQAATWLEHNEVNRRLRPRLVEAYASDMKADLWMLTGDPVQISRTGQLLNGQHRLAAIVQSGSSVQMLVITGLDDKAQVLMDQGAARTATDAARLAGVKNGAFSTSIARWAYLAPEPNGTLEQQLKAKASTAQILSILQQNPDIEVAAENAVSLRPHLPGSPTAIGYSWLLMNRVDHTDCKLFFDSYRDLTFKALRDPRKAVLKKLTSMANDPQSTASKDKAIATVSVLTRGWNAWRRGEEIESLNIRNSKGKVIAPVVPI